MESNPLLLTLAQYVGQGRSIKEIIVDNKINPTGFTIALDDGSTITHKVGSEVQGREEFVRHWKSATAYLREALIKERPSV